MSLGIYFNDQASFKRLFWTNIMKSITKSMLFITLLALPLMAVLSISGCASTSSQSGTGEYIDDSVITAKVKAAILNEETLKVAEINVETFKGVVQLSGFVSSQADIDRAVVVTRGVAGVKSVKNDMRVK
jgi:osmotically-inducible protein OsmY